MQAVRWGGGIVFLGVLVLILELITATRQRGQTNPVPGRSELWNRVWQLRRQQIVYGTGDPATVASYREFAGRQTQRHRWVEITAAPDTAVGRSELTASVAVLVGTPQSNRWLAELEGRLPLRWSRSGIRLGRREYRHPQDVIVVSLLPNPLGPTVPMSIVTGVSDSSVVAYLQQPRALRFGPGDYRVYRNGQLITFGFFNRDWQPDPQRERNFLAETRLVGTSTHFRFIYHGRDPLSLAAGELKARYERGFEKTAARLGATADGRKIEVHVYDSFETKGLVTGNTRLYHAEPARQRIHVVINQDFRGDRLVALARVLMARWPRPPVSPALEDALAMALSDGWGRKGYRHWAGFITASNNVIPLRRLFSPDAESQESPLFVQPLLGAWGEILLQQFDGQGLQKLASSWPAKGLPRRLPNGWTAARMAQKWRYRLGQLAAAFGGVKAVEFRPEFQKGFCYSHEGYQIYNGYMSEMSDASLGQLRELGANWISLTPFAFLSAMNRPAPFHFSSSAGSENDESLVQAATTAHRLGMKVMLKPHIWTHAGWPGDLQMRNEEDWKRFFDNYYRWIRHYALLAEMYDFDMLSIGVEVSKATLEKPQAWRKMIRRLRRIYHGPMTYAANWGEEFEKLGFWDELDYIGLNSYYPLSQSSDATAAELRRGAASIALRVEKVAQKYRKPVIFTEVGFPSTPAPWVQPHRENRRGRPDPQAQALAYRVMFETMWDQPWFYGFYWWKWPTVLDIGGERHTGFTPKGKPAQEVVSEWYQRRSPSRRAE